MITAGKAWAIWEERGVAEGAKASTIQARKNLWIVFERFLSETHGTGYDLREFTREDGVEFMLWLQTGMLRPPGAAYGQLARRSIILALKTVFSLLVENKLLLSSPVDDLSVVKPTKHTGRMVMREDEVSKFLDGIDEHAQLGLRDRCLMELLYSSALRPSEAGNLKVSDIDLKQRLILVRREKVGKVQVIPITDTATHWLTKQVEGRPADEYVFGKNHPFLPAAINRRFKKWVALAGIQKKGLTVYSLRHSCATHLLNHGADLRYVQHLLGHTSVETTVIYTNEQLEAMMKVYKTYHPRENRMWKEVWGEYEERLEGLKKEIEDWRKVRRVRIKYL